MAQPAVAGESAPLEVTLAVRGRFAAGSGWTLSVPSDGSARLTISGLPKKTRSVAVSRKQFTALSRELQSVRFFELDAEYGSAVPDGSIRTLTVREGSRQKTVTLRYLRETDPHRGEIRRALRVWHLVQDWFSDPAAVDLRRYDRRILEAP